MLLVTQIAVLALLAVGETRGALILFAAELLLFLAIGNGPLARELVSSLQHGIREPDEGQFGARSTIVLLGDGMTSHPDFAEGVPG